MPEIVFVSLRYFFLALLYLFAFLVARAVYRELQPPSPAAPAKGVKERRRAKARLVLHGKGKGRRKRSWELGEEAVIGRAGECAVTLGDEFVSNLHARVYRQRGRYYLEDLGSTNGTYVNGRRITYPVELRGGDKIRVGRTELEFRR